MHEKESGLPAVIKAGLLHVQFETIHPFLDGNGRIGRLLVTLYLCVHGVLRKPLLYLSLYLKMNRADYYRLLQEVRERGAWEAWLEFFLIGVAETANQAFDAATRIIDLFKQDRERITAESERAGSALRVHELLRQNPFLTANLLVERTALTAPTINAALADLERLGIVEEVTGRRRGRVFGYRRYLAILGEGTDPNPDDPQWNRRRAEELGSMRLVPVVRRARLDRERHGELHGRQRRLLHDAAHHGQRRLDLLLGRLEDEFVMHLQEHLRREARIGERLVHADHGAADDVGGRALDRGVDGGPLVEGPLGGVRGADRRVVASAPEDGRDGAAVAA